jgi:ketosteroid isomerase-like protein
MSQENVEIVRRGYELFNEGGPEAVISAGIWSPEIVWDLSPSEIPGAGIYRGHDEVRAFFEEDWFGAFPFEEWEVVVDQLVDYEDQVISVHHQRGLGRAAGWRRSSNRESSTPCAMVRSCGSRSTTTRIRPSKPPGCGSSEILRGRCQRG